MIELLRGSNGVARAALINASDESGPLKVLKRSIRHLIPIEVNDEEVDHEDQALAIGDATPTNDNLAMNSHSCDVNDNTALSAVEASSRLRRQAAVLGEAIRRVWTGQ